MSIFNKKVATSSRWAVDVWEFIQTLAEQNTSIENRKCIVELCQLIRSSSHENISVSTLEQGPFSNLSLREPSLQSSHKPDSVLVESDERALTCFAFSQKPECLEKHAFRAVLSFLKANLDEPVLAMSNLKNRVSVQCLIGGREIPLIAYTPVGIPGHQLSGSLRLHSNIFKLDNLLIEMLDPRIYQLDTNTAQKYKMHYLSKGWLHESSSHEDIENLHKQVFQEKIVNGANGFLTGLILTTPSLLRDDFALFYSLYLLTFFVLDDATESMESPLKAESFSKRALDILSGKVDVNKLHTEEGVQHPGYYLAAQLREMMQRIVVATAPDEFEQKLSCWYRLMANQFDSAVEEVASKGNIDRILPSYETHEEERSDTIGTRPCLEMIDVLLDVTWSCHMSRKINLIEKKVAKAVFEFNNVVSLHKELKEAFVDTKILSKSDFYALFNPQTVISNLPEDILEKLPLNGLLIRSYHSKVSLVVAMSMGISIYDKTIQELETALSKLLLEASNDKEKEALQARFSLAVGSTRWSMKTGRYTLDKKAVSDEWWKALNKELFAAD